MDEMRWWAQNAASGIRFRPDREVVEQELMEHMEDKQELLMRARGLSEQEAGLEAVRQMGDAREVGRELAAVHRPWLGWLWQASRVLLAALAVIIVVRGWSDVKFAIQVRGIHWKEVKSNDELLWEPYEGGNERYGDQVQLWTRDDVDSVRADEYLFRVERAALWGGRHENGEEFRMLYCRLAAYGGPWEPFSREAAEHIRATDSTGRTYRCVYETHRLGRPQGEQGAVLTIPEYEGWFADSFMLSAGVPVEAQWLRLEFDRGGTAWSLTIPLTEDEP